MESIIAKAKPIQELIMADAHDGDCRLATESTASDQLRNESAANDNRQSPVSPSPNTITVKSDTQSYTIQDTEDLVFSIVGFLNDNCDVPDFCHKLKDHKNVVFQSGQVELTCWDKNFNFISLYKGSAHGINLGSSEYPEKFINALLLQVTHGLHHMHKQKLSAGRMEASNIFLSCDKKNVVLRPDGPCSRSDAPCLRNVDVHNLGILFYQFLTDGKGIESPESLQIDDLKCSDKGVAKDLIRKMLKKEISCEEILKHPFFWTDLQKINFIVDAFDSCKHLEQDRQLESDAWFIPQNGWIKELQLSKREKTQIKDNDRQKNIKKQLNPDAVYNIAAGLVSKKSRKVEYTTYMYDDNKKKITEINSIPIKKWGDFIGSMRNIPTPADGNTRKEDIAKELRKLKISDECEIFGQVVLVKTQPDCYKHNSCYDLIRFFRNRKAHYWESKMDIRRCFQSYPHGFWNFFSSRFPEMLPYVYNNPKSFSSHESHTSNLTRNLSLPDVNTAV